MGILHDTVTKLIHERRQLGKRLEFCNVRSTGRDRIVNRLYEVDNELTYILRRPEGTEKRENTQDE